MTRTIAVVAALVAGAVAVTAGVLAGPAALSGAGFVLGGAGWLILAAALVWRPLALAPALVGVAFPTALAALDGHASTGALVIATTLVVVAGELAGWALDRRSVVPEGRAVTARRLSALAGVAGGSAVVTAGVLAAAALPAPGGALPVVAGTVAALAVLALAALRRW